MEEKGCLLNGIKFPFFVVVVGVGVGVGGSVSRCTCYGDFLSIL